MLQQPLTQRPVRRRHLIVMPQWVVRGLYELTRARFALPRIKPSDIRRLNRNAATEAGAVNKRSPHPRAVDRIALIIPLLASYVPWRSDCLIQAMAAQRWLAANGVAAEIRIGVDRPTDGEFGAHAWLVHDGRVITGGSIDHYAVLIGESDETSEAMRGAKPLRKAQTPRN